jgi:hypothetical protein
MSFGKRHAFGTPQARRPLSAIRTASPQSTGKWIALGAATGVLSALALIALIVGSILMVTKLQALELADRFAHQPADGPGYVNRKLNAKSRVDEECLGIWDNTLSGVRNTMLCYSTRHPERLCEPLEKDLFVRLVDEYTNFEKQIADATAATPQPILDMIENHLPRQIQVPREKVADAWKALAKIGVIEREDFGWFPDDFVATAFADVEIEKSVCSES